MKYPVYLLVNQWWLLLLLAAGWPVSSRVETNSSRNVSLRKTPHRQAHYLRAHESRKSNDPIGITMRVDKINPEVGEEIELTIQAQFLAIHPGLLFTFEDANSFRLKAILPDGFIVTGGNYYDYIGDQLTAAHPMVTYTIRGYFTKVPDNPAFRLLRGNGQANSASLFVEKGSILFKVLPMRDAAARLAGSSCSVSRPGSSLDFVNCNSVGGWALDQNQLSQTVLIDIYVDGVKTYSDIPADGDRQDLVQYFGGNGRYHGFTYQFPADASWRNGQNHTISVRICGTERDITSSPKIISGCTGSTTNPPDPTDPPVVTDPPANGTGTGLLGKYFNNNTLAGAPALSRVDARINFTWNDGGSPFPGVNATNMSVRWSGQVEAPVSGSYKFRTINDDATRLTVNGQLLINDWPGGHGPTPFEGTINLVAGQKYSIVLDFNQGGGGAQTQLHWEYPGQGSQLIPQQRLYPDAGTTNPPDPTDPPVVTDPPANGTGTGLLGKYFNNSTLSGTPALSRVDARINFTWNDGGSPFPGVNATNMSVRWSGQVEAPVSGSYKFRTINDDATRLTVNGQLLINDWPGGHGPTPFEGTINLVAGQKYSIVLDFNQGGGGAQTQLHWEYPGQGSQLIPQQRLYPDAGTINPPDPTNTCDGINLSASASPSSVNCGGPVQLTATCSGADCDGVAYSWSGNGLNQTGQMVNITVPAGNGNYSYVVTGTKNGCSKTATATVAVAGCSTSETPNLPTFESFDYQPITTNQTWTGFDNRTSGYTGEASWSGPVGEFAELDNGIITVRVHKKFGAAPAHISPSGQPNLINIHDLGTMNGYALYRGGLTSPNPNAQIALNWAPNPTIPAPDNGTGNNPIQHGDDFGNSSEVIAIGRTSDMIYTKTRLKNWPVNNETTDGVMEQWVKLEGRGAHVYTKVSFNRQDDQTFYVYRQQEYPCMYTRGSYRYAHYVNKDGQLTSRTTPQRAQYGIREPWVAMLESSNPNDVGVGLWGVGMYYATQFEKDQQQNGNEFANGAGYVSFAPDIHFDWNGVFYSHHAFVVGNVNQIRSWANAHPDPRNKLSWKFNTRNGRGWWVFKNGVDEGYPTPNTGITITKTGSSPEHFLLSPNVAVPASGISNIYIHMAVTGNQTARDLVFIKPEQSESAALSSGQRVGFSTVNDGQYRTVVIPVSSNSNWNGIINRIKIRSDGSDTGSTMKIKWINTVNADPEP